VRLEAVSKSFRRHPSPGRGGSLKALVAARLRRELPAPRLVLDHLDLEVLEGDCLAILGANGSGKTTLLRLIAGIYRPDAGRVCTRGRLATLLELGTGFHDDLSARANIVVNAALLGLGRRDAEARVDQVLAFAGLCGRGGDPLRSLSSGMILRLGFSVAVHLEPDVLLVDEALSVGDVEFRKRSLERIAALRDAGSTIVFTSHEPGIVERLATRAAVLSDAKLMEHASVPAALESYFGAAECAS
jgi:ABC-2 type transport system ATP-binding protein